MKVSFVILHFLTDKDTIECISSIVNNIEYHNYDIVVVDNGSNNYSIDRVKKNFEKTKNIHFIISKKNLGFAKGNNLGYLFAKNKLDADVIIMINNDIIIKQRDFIKRIISKYEMSKFHILGPDIISLVDKGHQNPFNGICKTLKDVKKRIFKLRILRLLNKIGLYNLTYKINKVLNNIFDKNDNSCEYLIEKEDVSLHGCCLIFGPEYVRKYNGLYSQTYMYAEEDILFYIARKDNLKTVYFPEIKIFHKEDSSTDTFLNKNRDKKEFFYKNSIDSLIELSKIIQDENRYKKDIYSNYLHQ